MTHAGIATSPDPTTSVSLETVDASSLLPVAATFLPDFTEHPKSKRQQSAVMTEQNKVTIPDDDGDDDDVTFFHDFVAGGVAGSASVVVGHPFDTIKVRLQTASGSAANKGFVTLLKEFGGIGSLYRGMAAPLSAAAVINAVVFGSYGFSSRMYDEYIIKPSLADENSKWRHDPWQKAMSCGSFAGFVQCIIICPMEHIKCRLQVQHGNGSTDSNFKGPVHAVRTIVKDHGFRKLFQGWWATIWREVPAFGMYFASYDHIKDLMLGYFESNDKSTEPFEPSHAQAMTSAAVAGGMAGCLTWGVIYPTDLIKTRIQTMPLDATPRELGMWRVCSDVVSKYGWRYLFRGLSVTLIRAFPVNGTIFPVYEATLIQVVKWENGD